MGRRSMTGGVVSKGSQRIQYDFRLNGVRYRPTLKAVPTEANLRRAREHLKAIKERIRLGTFCMEEFPDFRDWQKVAPHSAYRTCNQVFDQYLAHCESRLSRHDLSFAPVRGYRKALDSVWRRALGSLPFLKVQYSLLMRIVIFDAFTTLRSALNADLGCSALPCFTGDNDPELEQIPGTHAMSRSSLWVLTHPDLRRSARIHAFMEFFSTRLVASSKAFIGKPTPTTARPKAAKRIRERP